LVTANRMDGPHLARLSKFFGYAPVYSAILAAAPLKAQAFAQNAPIAFAAPTIGAPSPVVAAAMGQPRPLFALAANLDGGTAAPMQAPFKPNVSLTLEETYTGFRGMMVGSSAATAALYETTVYAGTQLVFAWGVGYGFGTGLTWVAQKYAPDWYYGPFVDTVGGGVDWFQNTVNTVGHFYGSSIYDLGHYESDVAPVMSVPVPAQHSMQDTGGDFGVTGAWNTYYVDNSGNSCARGQKCPTQPTA
jgi:hypothetical protein